MLQDGPMSLARNFTLRSPPALAEEGRDVNTCRRGARATLSRPGLGTTIDFVAIDDGSTA
jgi:hypothetical protein